MKHRTISALAWLAGFVISGTGATLHAQTIGAKVGPSFSYLPVNGQSAEGRWLTTFGGGGFARFGLGSFSIQPEILIVTKGSKLIGFLDSDFELKLEYVEVPVLLHFAVRGQRLAPYLLIGPTFSFESDCEAEVEIGDVEQKFDCDADEDAGDIVNRKAFDLGVAGAIGVDYRLGPGRILLEGRYTHGFVNIFDDVGNDSFRNRSFAILAGYSVALRIP